MRSLSLFPEKRTWRNGKAIATMMSWIGEPAGGGGAAVAALRVISELPDSIRSVALGEEHQRVEIRLGLDT